MTIKDEYDLWVSEHLEKLDFVEWDRFTRWEHDEAGVITRVFGWIDRQDRHEDFVQLEFQGAPRAILFLGTSSKEYSKEIHARLYGEAEHGHVECQRVEEDLHVQNSVKLEEQVKPE